MKHHAWQWLVVALLFGLALATAPACGDDDDDDNDDDDDGECVACESTGECTAAFGEGWGCIGDCCEQVGDDDATDDDSGDDDTAGDDDDDDNDTTAGPGEISWVAESVDRSGAGNRQTSIKVTAGGDVHLAYTGCTDTSCTRNELIHAVRAAKADAWAVESVDASNNDTGWYPSMEISPTGTLWIVYGNQATDTQHFAVHPAGGDWSTNQIGQGKGGWWNSSTVLDGNFAMAHTNLPPSGVDDTSLEVGVLAGGNWTFTTVDSTTDCGWFTAMAATPDARPVVTYNTGYFGGYLSVAEFEGGDWTITQIDEGSYGGDVAVDADGYVHAVYSKTDSLNANLWELWYATNAPAGSWSKYALDPGASIDDDTGGFPSIAIDDHGALHVAYRQFTRDALMYARLAGEEWEIVEADTIGGGLYTSIAIDAAGGVHVGYENGTTIKHAYCETCAAY